jgi:hypothetical protein
MTEKLLLLAEETPAPAWFASPTFLEALRISGVALVAIFFVMGLFGAMISLLARVFPQIADETE